MRQLVTQTERTPSQSQPFAEELRRLRLLVAPRERESQVGRRDQRALLLCAEQAGLLDEEPTLDLRSIGVLASL